MLTIGLIVVVVTAVHVPLVIVGLLLPPYEGEK